MQGDFLKKARAQFSQRLWEFWKRTKFQLLLLLLLICLKKEGRGRDHKNCWRPQPPPKASYRSTLSCLPCPVQWTNSWVWVWVWIWTLKLKLKGKKKRERRKTWVAWARSSNWDKGRMLVRSRWWWCFSNGRTPNFLRDLFMFCEGMKWRRVKLRKTKVNSVR